MKRKDTFSSQEKKGKGYLCRWSFRFLDERNIFETNHDKYCIFLCGHSLVLYTRSLTKQLPWAPLLEANDKEFFQNIGYHHQDCD